MLALLVPILISFLLEPTQLRNASKFCIQLHEQSLQWLVKIGPNHQQVRLIFIYIGNVQILINLFAYV